MKNLILFFPKPHKLVSVFEGFSEKMTLRENQMLGEIPQEFVNIYMIHSLDNFFEGNEFLPEFQLVGNTWQEYTSEKHVFGDLVYGFRMPSSVTHTHPSNISEITKDKSIIESIFPQHTLRSIVCENYKEIQDQFHNISSEKKVLKPSEGSLGKGIIIGANLPQEEDLEAGFYPYLLQEFHDTSGGFYGLCQGLHDFRIVILDGEIIAKILRKPAKGKYVSNTFQGGKIHDVFDFELPGEIEKIIQEIDSHCSKYEHRYYSIDMGLGTNGEIKIFELNGAPGYASEHMAKKFGTYLAKNILKV